MTQPKDHQKEEREERKEEEGEKEEGSKRKYAKKGFDEGNSQQEYGMISWMGGKRRNEVRIGGLDELIYEVLRKSNSNFFNKK